MAVTIKLRRGTTAQWTSANPILALGEVGIDTDLDQFKVGDGATAWASLAFATAPINSPTFTGTPTAPTAAVGTDTTQIATTAFVNTAVSNLIDAAPTALNTLNELAAAINDDASFATTITNSLALKAPLASPTFTGTVDFSSATVTGIDLLPSQTGNSGKFLTTNGTVTSWATVDALPSQSGNTGKYLTTDGTTASWSSVEAGFNPFLLMGA